MASQIVNDQRQDEAPAHAAAKNQPQDPPYGMPPALRQADPMIQKIGPPARVQGRLHGSQNAHNTQHIIVPPPTPKNQGQAQLLTHAILQMAHMLNPDRGVPMLEAMNQLGMYDPILGRET